MFDKYIKRGLCVSFGIGLESLNLSLTRVFFASDMFLPQASFSLSLYCISASTAPFNICSGFKAGIPFRISPLKCAHVTFIVDGTGGILQGEGGFCCRFFFAGQLFSNMGVKIVTGALLQPWSFGKLRKRLRVLDDHLSVCGNWHSKPPVHSGALMLSTWLLPWKSVPWGPTSVHVTSKLQAINCRDIPTFSSCP